VYRRGEQLTGLKNDTHFIKIDVVIGEEYYQIRKEIIAFINKMSRPLIEGGFIKETLISHRNIGHLHSDLVKRKEKGITVYTAYILYSYHLLHVIMTKGLDIAYDWLLEHIETYSKDVTEAWHFYLKREDVKKIIQFIAANRIQHPRLKKVMDYIQQNQGRKVIVCPDKELRKTIKQLLQDSVHVILVPDSVSAVSGKRLRRMYAEFSKIFNAVFIVSSLNDQIARRTDLVILPEINKRTIQNVVKYSDYDYKKVVFLTKETKEERIFNSSIKRKTKINLTEINKHLEEQEKRRRGQLKQEQVKIKYDPRIVAKGIPLDLKRLEDKGIELVEGRLKMIGLLVEKYYHFIFFLYPEFLWKFIQDDVLGDFCGIINKNYADTTVVMPSLHVYDELMFDTKKQIDDQLHKYGFKCYKGYPLNYLIPRIVQDLDREIRMDQGLHEPLLELLTVATKNIQRSKSVINKFTTMEAIRTATVEQLCEVDGVNVTTARSIKKYFN